MSLDTCDELDFNSRIRMEPIHLSRIDWIETGTGISLRLAGSRKDQYIFSLFQEAQTEAYTDSCSRIIHEFTTELIVDAIASKSDLVSNLLDKPPSEPPREPPEPPSQKQNQTEFRFSK